MHLQRELAEDGDGLFLVTDVAPGRVAGDQPACISPRLAESPGEDLVCLDPVPRELTLCPVNQDERGQQERVGGEATQARVAKECVQQLLRLAVRSDVVWGSALPVQVRTVEERDVAAYLLLLERPKHDLHATR